MSPQPPRSPLTATLFPSTTLFRSLAVPVAAARAAGVSAALAAVLVGGPSRRTVVIRRRRADHRDRLLGEPLDVPQVAALAAVAERDRHPAGAGTRGAADAVPVALRLLRQLAVDAMVDAGPVAAPPGGAGGGPQHRTAGTEGSARAVAHVLGMFCADHL